MDRTDDIVRLIDEFMSNGGGHMNVTVKKDDPSREKSVKIQHTADCPEGSTACSSPTLFEGLDRDEKE